MIVLYEDNHCVAAVKPSGMPSQDDASGDLSMLKAMRAHLKEAHNKPGNVFVGLVHRLDRPVGGVMIFGKTSKGAARLSEQIRSGTFQKTYLALVEGVPEKKEGEIVQWLKKNETANRVTAYSRKTDGAKRAELAYRVLKSDGKRALVEIKPKTGRPHQIRVAMKTLGTPIAGDTKYGAKPSADGAIALFASSVIFQKPVGSEMITVTADPPAASPISLFLSSL